MGDLHMRVLEGILETNLDGYRVHYDSDYYDGEMYFSKLRPFEYRAGDHLHTCKCFDMFTLRANGSKEHYTNCKREIDFSPYEIEDMWHCDTAHANTFQMDPTEAKVILAAMGEKFHPDFVNKHAREIEKMKERLYGIAGLKEEITRSLELFFGSVKSSIKDNFQLALRALRSDVLLSYQSYL